MNSRSGFRFLCSTVGQKIVIGITGLGLSAFLVVHLFGNLFMYGGPEAYNNYARKLHENELLPLAEAGLFAFFVLHIILAILTAFRNKSARNSQYAVTATKQDQVLAFQPYSFMVGTGLVIAVFLAVHITDMKMEDPMGRIQVSEGASKFEYAVAVLRNPISSVVYIVGSIFVGIHVWHGLQSAFRSIGFHHSKYSPWIAKFSVLFAIVIALGFASLPIYFNLPVWFGGK